MTAPPCHSHVVLGDVPVINQLDVIWALRRQLTRVAAWRFNPQIIHADFSALPGDGLAAVAVARRRASICDEYVRHWKDAAVSHGAAERGPVRGIACRGRWRRASCARPMQSRPFAMPAAGHSRQGGARGPGYRHPECRRPRALQRHGRVARSPALKARFCAPVRPAPLFSGPSMPMRALICCCRRFRPWWRVARASDVLLVGGGPEEQRCCGTWSIAWGSA